MQALEASPAAAPPMPSRARRRRRGRSRPPASSRRSLRCSSSPARGSRRARVVAQSRALQRSTPAGGLEPRDGRDEMPARQVVRRRERLAVGAVRALLGDGRGARTGSARRRGGTSAARVRAGARRAARSASRWAIMAARMRAAPPLVDVLDDEQVLARAHVAERRASPRERHRATSMTRAAARARSLLACSCCTAACLARARRARRSTRSTAGSRGARRARARPRASQRRATGPTDAPAAFLRSSHQPEFSGGPLRSSGYWRCRP